MISRIITNLAIYFWYYYSRTKERCDTSSNHLQLLYKLTEKRSMFFTTYVSYRRNVLYGHMNV